MQTVTQLRKPTTDVAQWRENRVIEETPDGGYCLDDGVRAMPAVSCLLRPRRGDRVLAVGCEAGDVFILAILERVPEQAAELCVPGASRIALAAPQLALYASENLQLQSLHDVDVTAVDGNVSVTARNLLTTVSDAIIENMQHYIGRAAAFALQVQSLLRMHGKQAIVTADEDVRIDAERITMG